jgi:hypothetical protein
VPGESSYFDAANLRIVLYGVCHALSRICRLRRQLSDFSAESFHCSDIEMSQGGTGERYRLT